MPTDPCAADAQVELSSLRDKLIARVRELTRSIRDAAFSAMLELPAHLRPFGESSDDCRRWTVQMERMVEEADRLTSETLVDRMTTETLTTWVFHLEEIARCQVEQFAERLVSLAQSSAAVSPATTVPEQPVLPQDDTSVVIDRMTTETLTTSVFHLEEIARYQVEQFAEQLVSLAQYSAAVSPATTVPEQPVLPQDDTSVVIVPPPALLTTTEAVKAHADGPEGGRWVWWEGKRHNVKSGVVYRLIAYMWKRDSAKYDDLMGGPDDPVWEADVAPQTVRSKCSEASKALLKIGVPWKFSSDSKARTVTKCNRD